MKKLFVSLLFLFSVHVQFACTTFFLNKNGRYIFGRNYDWITGVGVVHTNLRGLRKTSLLANTNDSLNWISKYGSITFNQYGKEFPTGGMNEKGLVVELMWLDETKYPDEDVRPSINVLQWIQFQLDNSASVNELLGTDKNIRIGSKESAPLHYLVADATGNAATIEFLGGKMVVHKENDLTFPVLTNTTYKEALKQANSVNIGNKALPLFPDNSVQRFVKACSMIKRYNEKELKTSEVDYAFLILDEVAQSNFTQWSIVYDINNKRIFFKTKDFIQRKSFDFSAFDFSCGAQAMSFNMNQSLQGNINHEFENFTNTLNRKFLEKAIHESMMRVTITARRKESMINLVDLIRCD